MARIILSTIIIAFSLFQLSPSYAFDLSALHGHNKAKTAANKHQQTTTTKQSTTINLYETSTGKKIIKPIPITQAMVRIIQKGSMIKVGLKDSTGTVGWINAKQYQAAQRAFYQPNIQTIFIENTQAKNGPPTINIIAYKNGERLSDKQAKMLYTSIRNDENKQSNYMLHFQQAMQKMMIMNLKTMNNDFNHAWFNDTPNQT